MHRRIHAAVATLAAALVAGSASAQTVDTYVTGFVCDGDLAVDGHGNLFISSEHNDTVIRKVTPEGVVTVFSTSFNDGRGLAVEATGDTLFAANNILAGPIKRIAPDGTKDNLTNGLTAPTGIAFGPSGALYVCGASRVYKVLPDGTTTILTQDSILNRPHGVAVDDDENIYVASAHDGNVYRLVEQGDGTATVAPFAFVDGLQQQWACGFMTFLDDALYITNGDNKVHRISLTGDVTDYAGTGAPGGLDGPADQATFFAPNGIAAAPDGRIFVAEYAQMRVRVITPATTGAAPPAGAGAGLRLLPNRPNPFTRGTTIGFELPRTEAVRLAVYDTAGRVVRTLVEGTRSAGRHEAHWDGRTDRGTTAAPGVYFYRLEADGGATAERMTRVR